MKIKVGPPLWNIVEEVASISDFKYSKALSDYKKIGQLMNFIFLKIPKNISKEQK